MSGRSWTRGAHHRTSESIGSVSNGRAGADKPPTIVRAVMMAENDNGYDTDCGPATACTGERGLRVAFLVPSLRLSGGLNVVMEHGSRLARNHGFDVTMVITHHPDETPWAYDGLGDVSVEAIADVNGEPFDLAIATWWDTVSYLSQVRSHRFAYFVQSLEDRFYVAGDPQRQLAGLTYRIGLPVITEARWIADLIEQVRPGQRCWYVRNGVNKDIFPVTESIDRRDSEPLRILIEGNVDDHIKGVPEALEAIRLMHEPAQVTVVSAKGGDLPGASVIGPIMQRELSAVMAQTDVVLKLSRVEGMSGPPLEGFHRGATAVLTPVTGHDEYVHHGWNSLLTGWDDPTGTARQLDLLARDRDLLDRLRSNAQVTARVWPDWDDAAAEMAAALQGICTAGAFDLSVSTPLFREAKYQISSDARRIHFLKTKVLATEQHVEKLEGQITRVSNESHERAVELLGLRAHSEALESRMTAASAALATLERSRSVRTIVRVQHLARRVRSRFRSWLSAP